MKKLIKWVLIIIALAILITPIRTGIMKWIYPLHYSEYINEYSQNYNVDKYLVMGVISTESNFDYNAESHKNAKGLMQITENTAEWCIKKFGIESTTQTYKEPKENIEIGCAYLSYLIEHFDGNKRNALAAYNAGLGHVEEWLADSRYSKDGKTLSEIPFPETEKYVEKVEAREKIYKNLYK